MANIPGEIVWQANDNTWFTNNAAEVYPAGITIYHVDGRYKFTDGVTTLGALPFRGDNLVSVTHYTESFAYTGSPFTLTVAPNYIFSIRTTSMVLDESDVNDVTISGTTLTVINPAFQAGETLYIKYKG